jgi:prevent-host-death family protein
MEEIAVSEFKAKCLGILQRVRKTKTPVRITRFGTPIAEVIPPSPSADRADWFGSMAGTVDIRGDIVSPVSDLHDIEALRD